MYPGRINFMHSLHRRRSLEKYWQFSPATYFFAEPAARLKLSRQLIHVTLKNEYLCGLLPNIIPKPLREPLTDRKTREVRTY
jgi:hypothetical protein